MTQLTDLICSHSSLDERIHMFIVGYHAGRRGERAFHGPRSLWMHVRRRHGFTAESPLLTPPEGNLKLDKSAAWGLTLQSHHTKLTNGLRVNSCPNAGHCVKVCVLNNGNGRYDLVQRARDARTEFFAEHPVEFLYLMGHEMGKHDVRLMRPNVNADLDWHRILGDVMPNGVDRSVTFYGYTKRTEVAFRALDGFYVESLSLHERSDLDVARLFLKRGGNLAVVTNRKPNQDVEQWAHKLGLDALVVDADKTDQWMLDARGVIGDLSAKGKARRLIGKSDFVRVVY